MKKEIFTPKFIATVGVLIAVEIVLYIVGANIAIGGININLALIPIAIGAILYGPICGLILGLVNSVSTLLTPAVQGYFMNQEIFGEWCVLGTFCIVLIKTSTAGLIAGFVYKTLEKKRTVAIIVASLLVPILNTGIFLIGALFVYKNQFDTILAMVVSFNFLIEFGSTLLLTPAIIRIIDYTRREKYEA